MSDIDFIIPWVDGSDPEWLSSYNRYAPAEKRISHADACVSKNAVREHQPC